jgi:HSP20 family protein
MANEMNPFRDFPNEVRDLFGVSRRINRLFDDVFERMPNETFSSLNGMAPRIEVQDAEDAYVFACEMPGVPKENVTIEIRGDQLFLFGERHSEVKGRKGSTGEAAFRYEQLLSLPQGVDGSNIEADYKDGILYIAVPKGGSDKRRKIEIGSGRSGILSKLKDKVTHAIGGATSEESQTGRSKGTGESKTERAA